MVVSEDDAKLTKSWLSGLHAGCATGIVAHAAMFAQTDVAPGAPTVLRCPDKHSYGVLGLLVIPSATTWA